MKKLLVLGTIVLATLSLSSCDNSAKTENNETVIDTDTTAYEVEETIVETDTVTQTETIETDTTQK